MHCPTLLIIHVPLNTYAYFNFTNFSFSTCDSAQRLAKVECQKVYQHLTIYLRNYVCVWNYNYDTVLFQMLIEFCPGGALDDIILGELLVECLKDMKIS